MDIARRPLDRLVQNQVDQLHHRRIFDRLLEFVHIDLFRVLQKLHFLAFFNISHYFVEGIGSIVETINGSFDGAFGRDKNLHVTTGQEFNVVDRQDVGGIAHGHPKGRPDSLDGDRLVFEDDIGGDHLGGFRIDLDFIQVDGRYPIMPTEE